MYRQYQRMILGEWRNNEQVIDGVKLNEQKNSQIMACLKDNPCAWSHWSIPPSSSLLLPVPPSSVPGPSQSIILSTASSSFHPLNPIRSGKQWIFLVQFTRHSWHQFHPFLLSAGSPQCTIGKSLAKCIWCFALFTFYLMSSPFCS